MRLKPGLVLYVARHGQTVANLEHRFSGPKDTPLTDLGRRQAAAVGAILKREAGMADGFSFVSSPLARARTSMRIIRQAMGLAPDGFATDARLAEIDLGSWDQLTEDEARARDPDFFARRMADKWNVRLPGGENYAEVALRVCEWLAGLTASTIAVSHGATTRILRGTLMGLDWQGMSALDEPQGVVFRIIGSEVVRLDP